MLEWMKVISGFENKRYGYKKETRQEAKKDKTDVSKAYIRNNFFL
jgi:hypothetical protein